MAYISPDKLIWPQIPLTALTDVKMMFLMFYSGQLFCQVTGLVFLLASIKVYDY